MKLTERQYSLLRMPLFPLVLFRSVILFWAQSELFQPNKIAFLSLAFLRMDREVSASRLAETSQHKSRCRLSHGGPSVSGRGAGRGPQEACGSSQDSSPKGRLRVRLRPPGLPKPHERHHDYAKF